MILLKGNMRRSRAGEKMMGRSGVGVGMNMRMGGKGRKGAKNVRKKR